jgi:uncharacterized damage-inducible protein DinB
MDLREHLGRLLVYDDWANREVLAMLGKTGGQPARSVQLMAHIFSAERLWLERLQLQKQSLPVWPEFSLQQCEAQAAELPGLWRGYLDRNADLARPVGYKNSKGEPWTSPAEDVLLHVVMHSAYHRGQIASDMRAAGFTPASTDFIHAVRQGFVDEVGR